MEAQLAALNEQYDQERAMLANKLGEQMRDIEEINARKLKEANDQLIEMRHEYEQSKIGHIRQIELIEQQKEEAVLSAVSRALEPLETEIDDLRKDREELMKLRKQYEELQARIEPFWVSILFYLLIC